MVNEASAQPVGSERACTRNSDHPAARSAVLVVPAYRPTEVLIALISGIVNCCEGAIRHIVVVDDGGGPDFHHIFNTLAKSESVTVLRHAVNLGKGAALKTGFNHVLLQFPEAAGVVTADADGQHALEDIVQVARSLSESPQRVVLGVRGFDGDVPLRSRFGNSVTRHIFRLFTGTDLIDTQTGLRGWPMEACRQCLRIPINGYDYELECLLQAHRSGDRQTGFQQVPIRTIYADNNRGSHFNPLKDSMRIYFVFLRYCASSVMAAVIDSVIFYLTHSVTGSVASSQIAGRSVALCFAFVVNRNLVFHSNTAVIATLARYITLVVAMGFVSYALLTYLNQSLGVPVLPAKMIAEGLLFIANFSIQRQAIFTRKSAPESN